MDFAQYLPYNGILPNGKIAMDLYMILLGATPKGRLIEQHDLFFGIAPTLADLQDDIDQAWAEADGNWHIDAYRKVRQVEQYQIKIIPKSQPKSCDKHLFLLNLGGYRPQHFGEFHHTMLIVADDLSQAIEIAKNSEFFQSFSIDDSRAISHIDNRYGVDIDDAFAVMDILPSRFKMQYQIDIIPMTDIQAQADEIVLGYLPKKHLTTE